jgi:hypothetical protein
MRALLFFNYPNLKEIRTREYASYNTMSIHLYACLDANEYVTESWTPWIWRQGKGYDDSPNFFLYLLLLDTPIRLALGVGKGRIYIHLHLHLFSLLLSWSLCVSSFWDRRRWRHDDSPPHAKSNGCHMYTFPCINMHLLPKMKSILFKINPHAIRTAAYAGRQTVTPLAALKLWRLADRESLPRWAVN